MNQPWKSTWPDNCKPAKRKLLSTPRHLILLLILLFLAGASWWALTIIDPDRRPIFTESKEGPDHFMEQFTSTTLNEAGIPVHQLKAISLTHYPNQRHSELEDPVMTFFREDNSKWVASAKEGRILDDGEEVFLQGDVKINQPGDDSSRITIVTRDLHILPNEDFAETPNTVVMQQKENTITAIGMQAHFGHGVVDLLSEVRGWYAD